MSSLKFQNAYSKRNIQETASQILHSTFYITFQPGFTLEVGGRSVSSEHAQRLQSCEVSESPAGMGHPGPPELSSEYLSPSSFVPTVTLTPHRRRVSCFSCQWIFLILKSPYWGNFSLLLPEPITGLFPAPSSLCIQNTATWNVQNVRQNKTSKWSVKFRSVLCTCESWMHPLNTANMFVIHKQ